MKLSIIFKFESLISRYSLQFFIIFPAPFITLSPQAPPTKKQHKQEITADLDIVNCCYNLLSSDHMFYKNKWNWSQFLNMYLNKACQLQKLYCYNILAIFTNCQLKELNKNIPQELIVHNEIRLLQQKAGQNQCDDSSQEHSTDEKTILWNFSRDLVTNVQGVLLTIFDVADYRYYQSTDGLYDKTVMVESTKINLRSLALGISFGKAICLSGPVGCGKTTLVEYVARQTGRVAIKTNKTTGKENRFVNVDQLANGSATKKSLKNKRKADDDIENEIEDNPMDTTTAGRDGFLRIQLGDQTDSKMFLGQYRCTDVPGEFIWQPGVLTKVINFFF